MDDKGMKTLFLGLLIGFGVYGLSFATRFFFAGETAIWVSIALTLLSMVITIGWFIAVQRGWRLGRAENRGERRAKLHAQEEREKARRMR